MSKEGVRAGAGGVRRAEEWVGEAVRTRDGCLVLA